MRVLDLFSGIGGFSLGLERAGMKTVAFCEIDLYCRKVLAKHWPGVPIYHDVRELSAQHLTADGIGVDLICGGFPCQDISVAGKGAGISGERSGLWKDYSRLIGEIRPQYIIVENVAALLGRGIEQVLGDLASLGYDAEWHIISAADVGAPHLRERVWIVAYSISADGWGEPRISQLIDCERWWPPTSGETGIQSGDREACSTDVKSNGEVLAHSNREQTGRSAIPWSERNQWFIEPDVGRVANGIPARMDRLRGLGNSLVPQIPELIGRAILAAEQSK